MLIFLQIAVSPAMPIEIGQSKISRQQISSQIWSIIQSQVSDVNFVHDTNFSYVYIMTLTLKIWPWVKVRTHPWVMENNYEKYYGYVCNVTLGQGHYTPLVHGKQTDGRTDYHVHKLISIYVHCDPELWPVTTKIKRVNSLTMGNMYVCQVRWRNTQ